MKGPLGALAGRVRAAYGLARWDGLHDSDPGRTTGPAAQSFQKSFFKEGLRIMVLLMVQDFGTILGPFCIVTVFNTS